MSVLIKGMDMPKAGDLLQVAENVDGTIFIQETTHGEWHQIVVVPTPHGRLIDADAFERNLMMMPENELCIDCGYNVTNELNNALTVIEAEVTP